MIDRLLIFFQQYEPVFRWLYARKAPIIIILAGCILTLPVIIYGVPFHTDDGITHASWSIHFSEQFWSGDLYPRWLTGMNNGLGSPVFFYYPPVPYFLTSIIKPLFQSDPLGFYRLGISACLALILSGLFAYLWLKQIVNETPALITAILYMAGPYHLAADLYTRFAYAEFWSFVWLPLILYFTHKIMDRRRMAIAGFAVSYALLIMTHLPTTLIFSLVPVIYSLVLQKDQKLKTAGKITLSMTLGIGLSAIYLYPALAMQKYVFLDQMGIGYFSYENWLFFSNFSLWTDDKLVILLMLTNLLGIAGLTFIISQPQFDTKLRKAGLFWLTMALGSVLMMTDLSRPIWLVFFPLQKIQFPFRFNVILTLAATALTALAVSTITKSSLSTKIAVKVCAFVLFAAWIPVLVWAALTAFPTSGTDKENFVYGAVESKDAPEYRPRSNTSMRAIDWETSKDEDNWDVQMTKEYKDLVQRTGVQDVGTTKVKIVEGMGQVDVLNWRSRDILLHVTGRSEMKINILQFYFPNWTARIEGEPQDLTIQPTQPDGLISLSIPGGDHEVRLLLGKTGEELTGQMISLVSMIFLVFYIVGFGLYRVYRTQSKNV